MDGIGMSDAPTIQSLRADGAAVLTIDNPAKANALTLSSMRDLHQQIRAADDDPSVRVVVITGVGRSFCSGAQLELPSGPLQEQGKNAVVDAANSIIRAIIAAQKPVVAVINGGAAGFGASLALACDLVVIASSGYFELSFTKIGLMPDGGATALFAAAIGRNRALRMALLGDRISSAEALSSGLVGEIIPDGTDPVHIPLVAALGKGPTAAYAATKKAINQAALPHLDDVLRAEENGQARLMQTADLAEGIDAFREKRNPRFIGV